jgi:hypothetical protein
MAKRTVSMRSTIRGSTITVYLDSLDAQERTAARKALDGLERWNVPRIRCVELNYGGILTCEAIVNSKRNRADKRKKVQTLVCLVVRRAVNHHRTRKAYSPPRQPRAAYHPRQLRALAASPQPVMTSYTPLAA